MALSPLTSPQQGSAEPTPPGREQSAADDGPASANTFADEASALFSEAVRCHQGGRRGEAISLYERLLALDPNLPEVHCNLGAALAELGRLDEAELSFRRAITIDPDYPDPLANLGMVLRDAGRLDEAESMLRRALSLKASWPEVRSKLGITLYQMGNLEEAETAFRDAIVLKPDLAEACSYLAMTLKELGRFCEAELAFRRAISLKPESAELHFGLGTTLMNLGRTREAVPMFRQAIALQPAFAEASNNLGTALLRLGMPDEAEAVLRQVIALKPDFANAYNSLGNVLLDQGRQEDAMAAYRNAIALRPNRAEAHYNIGLALKELGRFSEAREAMEQAIRLAPRQAAYFRNLGDLRRLVAGEPLLAAMEALADDGASLSVQDQIELHFARAKAFEDLGEHENSFRQLLAGNALKRHQITYEETKILGGLKRVEAVFTPDLIRTRQGIGELSPLPVFIVGMLRAGTTLLEQILASHPQVFGAGELKHFGNAAANIHRTQTYSVEFPEVVSNMSDERFRELGAYYVAVLKRIAPDAVRVVNKMPGNFIHAGLIHLALPNAVIIHAVRDPVDTCVSCFSKLFGEPQNHTYDLAELGRYYRGYQTLMRHWHQVLPHGRILEVHYEDTVADLEGTARRIVAHCGLPWDPLCLEFHRTERPVRTASATQVRQPIYRSAVGRWRPYEPFLGPLLAVLRTGCNFDGNCMDPTRRSA